MSYCRYGHPLVKVEGVSKNYVFLSVGTSTGYGIYGPPYIEDVGEKITDENLVEMIWNNLRNDEPFKEYITQKLAERLKVKLRPKPLLDGVEYEKECQRVMKEKRS